MGFASISKKMSYANTQNVRIIYGGLVVVRIYLSDKVTIYFEAITVTNFMNRLDCDEPGTLHQI